MLTSYVYFVLAGVADGVGGWREYGVDPSQFPLTLMQTCERMVKQGHFQPKHPRNLIKGSYEELLENKSSLIGKTSFCICIHTCIL